MEEKIKLKLMKIETELDYINSQEGDKDQYCIFCKSIKYNGQVGIVHLNHCIIIQLRLKIVNL